MGKTSKVQAVCDDDNINSSSNNNNSKSKREKEDKGKSFDGHDEMGNTKTTTTTVTPSDEATTTTTTKKKRQRKRKRATPATGAEDRDNQEDDEEIITSHPSLPPATLEDERTAQLDRTVYVDGIPFSATEQDVKDFFGKNGLDDIEDCRLPVFQDTGRLLGYGHVVFTSVESRNKAIRELSGKYMNNRYLLIREAKAPTAATASSKHERDHHDASTDEPSPKIILLNLSYNATEDDIQPVMEQFGKIVQGGVRLVRHSTAVHGTSERKSKGFAYVEYEHVDSAKKAMKANIVILNRTCRVDYDHGRVRGSFRTANGSFWHREQSTKKKKS